MASKIFKRAAPAGALAGALAGETAVADAIAIVTAWNALTVTAKAAATAATATATAEVMCGHAKIDAVHACDDSSLLSG